MSSVAGANFYTLTGVKEIQQRGEQDLNLLMAAKNLDMDNLVDKIIDDLTNKIDFLKEQESRFLTMFECDDISDFKQKVEAYYNYSPVGNFTGKELSNLVKEFQAINNKKIKERGELIERLIYNIVQKDFEEFTDGDLRELFHSGQITEEAKKFIVQRIIEILSKLGLGKGGNLQIDSTSRSIGIGTNDSGEKFFEIVANATTTAFNQHIRDLQSVFNGNYNKKNNLTQKQKDSLKDSAVYLQPFNKTSISGTRMKQTFALKWTTNIGSLTGGTGKESDLQLPTNSDELAEFNTIMRELVVDKLMSYVPNSSGEIRDFIDKRIYYMITQDPKMFFIGGAFTKFEGVLGEISAVIALTDLLGKKYTSKALSWIGSQRGTDSKKQPSVDIALQEIGGWQFGVQVKNTTDELKDDFLHNIKFVDTSVDLIFQRLGINSDNIQNVLIADHFNVPYKRYGNTYESPKHMPPTFKHQSAEAFADFTNVEAAIDNIVADIITYLTLFASDFLYIGLGEDFQSQLATLDAEVLQLGGSGGNFVFIVGPKVFFASEILTQLQEDLSILKNIRNRNEQMNFQLQTSFETLKDDESEGTYTIITFKNNQGKGRPSLSEHTLKMRSSWNFHE